MRSVVATVARVPSLRRVPWPVGVLVGAFLVSRLVYALAGVRYSATQLTLTQDDMWQLLDVHLLRSDLLQSVWYLHSQPPLFNLYAGLVLHLPVGLRTPFEVTCSLVLGLAIVLATYGLLRELTVPVPVALVVTLVGVVAAPAYVLYENWFTYAYPSAAANVVGAWFLVKYLRTRRAWFGVGAFGSAACLVLLNSTYQVEWLLVVTVVVLVALRHQWKQVVAVALVPLALVAVWSIKDVWLFGTTSTSSWMGMNLARMVLYQVPPPEMKALERRGVVTSLALIPAFGQTSHYVPRYAHLSHTGIVALDAPTKQNGSTNYDNRIYVSVSEQYLHDDLAFIRAEPGQYGYDIGMSVETWVTPTDQNFADVPNWHDINGYVRAYDRVVEWQPDIDPGVAYFTTIARLQLPWSWLSLQAMALMALTLLGGPVVAWRRRRDDPPMTVSLAVLWITTAYVFVVTSLLEVGENERFRFELGPLPLVVSTVVVVTVWRGVRRRVAARRAGPSPGRAGAAGAADAATAGDGVVGAVAPGSGSARRAVPRAATCWRSQGPTSRAPAGSTWMPSA